VWSLGVCLFAIHFGFFPFEQAKPESDWRARRAASAQLNGESTMETIFGLFSQREPCHSRALISLLDRMLVFEPKQRASLSEVAASEWISRWADPDSSALPEVDPPLPYGPDLPSSDLSRCDSQPLSELSYGTLRPTVERQYSSSTIHSASSRTSTSSISGKQPIPIQAQAQRQTQVEEEEVKRTCPWAAVRYAIAGARLQIRQHGTCLKPKYRDVTSMPRWCLTRLG
jgi:serine/threonine protein kinase